jgi:hypothetical protein
MLALSRILLIEDDPADTRLALEALQELNLSDQIFTVSDGVEALDFLYLFISPRQIPGACLWQSRGDFARSEAPAD